MTFIRSIGGMLLPVLLLTATALAADEAAIVKPTTDFSRPEKYEVNAGGAASVRPRDNADAFSQSSANLALEHEMRFKIGNGFFKRLWVSAPSSTQASDGLGPLFNARSCQRCHLKDGRGHPPENEHDTAVSMFLRLSIPPRHEDDEKLLRERRVNVINEPTYGGQLQDFAIQGIDPEGKVRVRYTEQLVELADGTVVSLRKPVYSVSDLKYGPMHPDVMLSPRVAPQMIGLGLLEMISADDIAAHTDPDDKDGDGISGRANMVWDNDRGAVALGRFGWKAGNPTIRQQTGGAFAGDIGISSPIAPQHHGDCTEAQSACRAAPDGASAQYENLEAPEDVLELVTHYSRNLAVPQRRDVGKESVLRGKKVFYASGCIACHVPKFITRTEHARPEHSHQLIWPYTDLLLHDMGEGLADGRPEGAADGYEWRTPPLWGIGLTESVSGHTYFLHDGRARNLLEAILWHGGEAEAAKNKIIELDTEDRNALIEFLESL
ncbi:MAG: c-type cytochrome [Rhodospirillales bacterium]|nr:c-type cytochrome [Rhodospirillales bacterium]MBO6788281.1 c-type cytochrome [Rhodospirillales bacterium]